jgi:hypothetical protein
MAVTAEDCVSAARPRLEFADAKALLTGISAMATKADNLDI